MASYASAAMSCANLFLALGKGVEVRKTQAREDLSQLNLTETTFEASANSSRFQHEVSELVGMMAYSRPPVISDKEINSKGKIVLGLQIGNGFSLELKYRHIIHETEGNIYVLDHINMYTPSGKQLDVSSNPIDAYDIRKLADGRKNYEIESYPGEHNVTARIPTFIGGDVMREIQNLAPKLELVPKDVIRELAKESDVKALRKKANLAYMKYFIKRYSIRGIFKTLFKVVVYNPIQLVATAGIIYVATHTMNVGSVSSISELIFPKQNTEWVSPSIQDSASSQALPATVREQLTALSADLEAKQVTINKDATGTAMDLNASHMQISNNQYLWATTMTDKVTGKTVSIIFISRDNKHGQVSYAALQVDSFKYKNLINYIQSVGQFIPVTPEDLK